MKSIRSAGRLVKEGARVRPVIATQAALCRVPVQPRCAVAGPSVRRYATAHEPVSIEAIPAIASDKTYDIVIIGGGNAGLALACALLDKPSIKSSAKILLLEAGSLDRVRNWDDKGHWENRISSLTAQNVEWLKRIGAWEHIAQARSNPVEEMIVSGPRTDYADNQVWANPDSKSTPSLHFPPLGHPMAYMTENTNLQRALLRRIEQIGNGVVEIREGGRVEEMRLGGGDQWVGLKVAGSWVRGGVVVGADGPNSPVRHFSQIESYGHGYETHGLVATLHHAQSPLYANNTAFQRFLPTGPLAFLPLSPTASTMVWSTHPTHAAAYKRLSPEALVKMVNAGYTLHEAPLARVVEQVLAADRDGQPIDSETLGNLIREIQIDGGSIGPDDALLPYTVDSIPPKSVASFPLKLTHAEKYMGHRTVLVGDAGHTIHPLAGQGLNMGLYDVQSLANAWERAKATGGDLGTEISSKAYERERYPQNTLMLTTTDLLHHTFRNRSAPFNFLRGTGLDVINQFGGLKKLLMSNAGANIKAGRSDLDREFGRNRPDDELRSAGGWPNAAASTLEGWLGFKSIVGASVGVMGDIGKGLLIKAADAVKK